MGHQRIFDQSFERNLLPRTLHSNLVAKARSNLAKNASILQQCGGPVASRPIHSHWSHSEDDELSNCSQQMEEGWRTANTKDDNNELCADSKSSSIWWSSFCSSNHTTAASSCAGVTATTTDHSILDNEDHPRQPQQPRQPPPAAARGAQMDFQNLSEGSLKQESLGCVHIWEFCRKKTLVTAQLFCPFRLSLCEIVKWKWTERIAMWGVCTGCMKLQMVMTRQHNLHAKRSPLGTFLSSFKVFASH